MPEGLYVQYGCGWRAPSGWLNFDASPTLRIERIPLIGRLCTKNAIRFPENVRYGDIVRGLPIGKNSCAGIYCSHVLEHLALEDADRALGNTYSYLMAGGTFRLVVPDLEQLASSYLGNSSSDAANYFMEKAGLGRKTRPRGFVEFVKTWLGNSAHLWMWDERSMRQRLGRHGFQSIRRCSFGDAPDPEFHAVEDEDRFQNCLAMECKK